MSNSQSDYPGSRRPGGGGYCKIGSLNINDSVFSGNSSFDGGGAVSADFCDLTVTRSAFHDNRNGSGGFGGGAFFINGGRSATITNSTFYNNDGGGGGSALYLRTTHASGVHLTHVTITGNRNGEAVETAHNSTVLHLRNSIIYGNPAGDCKRFRGALATNENNIIGVPGNCGAGTNGSSDDPLLASSTTGDIPYFTTSQNSPAIDAAGDCASLTTEDQRGVTRPQGNGCDIGAYESTAPCCPPDDFTVTEKVRHLLLTWSKSDPMTTHYTVQLKTTDAPNQAATGNDPSTGWRSLPNYGTGDTTTSPVILVIWGVTPGTAYDVRVRAVNQVGAGPWATGQGTPEGGNGGV